MAEATVMVEVEGVVEHTAATGHGPVNALDNALRKALLPFYPRLAEMSLRDFKVRVLSASDGTGGTASVVRVLIESGDADSTWVTVGMCSSMTSSKPVGRGLWILPCISCIVTRRGSGSSATCDRGRMREWNW